VSFTEELARAATFDPLDVWVYDGLRLPEKISADTNSEKRKRLIIRFPFLPGVELR
jgi:hypothetical protein